MFEPYAKYFTMPPAQLTTKLTGGNGAKRNFSSNLLEHVLRRENLQAAWKRVRANKGAVGIDGMTIDEFPAWARSGHWSRVTNELATGRYTPSLVTLPETAVTFRRNYS